MDDVPTSMAELQARVDALNEAGKNVTVDEMIISSLQDWAKFLLDEGFEGSYFTPKINGNELVITDIMGDVAARVNVPDASYIDAYKADPKGTVHNIELALRRMIDKHEISL